MICPHCEEEVLGDRIECSHCGYDIAVAANIFGADSVFFPPVSDLAGDLSIAKGTALSRKLEKLDRRFSPAWFGVCIVALPKNTTVAEFGFWLINHASPKPGAELSNEYAVLLIVDPRSQTAGFSVGYAIEQFVTNDELRDSLNAARSAFAQSNWAQGCEIALSRFTRNFAKGIRQSAPRRKWSLKLPAPLAAGLAKLVNPPRPA